MGRKGKKWSTNSLSGQAISQQLNIARQQAYDHTIIEQTKLQKQYESRRKINLKFIANLVNQRVRDDQIPYQTLPAASRLLQPVVDIEQQKYLAYIHEQKLSEYLATQIEIGNLPDAVYFLNISEDNKVIKTFKIVKN